MPAADHRCAQDPEQVARDLVLRRLAAAPRTRAELASALARRGIPDEVADALLDRLTEVGLIDDAAFAEAWVRSRHTGRGLGRRALAQELRSRGIDRDVVREAVAGIGVDEERDRARQLVQRRLATLATADPATAARRLAGMLARRGYSAEVTAQVVGEALEGALEDNGEGALGDDCAVEGPD